MAYILPNGQQLQPGDVACTRGTMPVVSAGIRLMEQIWAEDNEATYGHSFIVADDNGAILDTLWRVQWRMIDRYHGEQIIIARPSYTVRGWEISAVSKAIGLEAVAAESIGRVYPIHRLALHMLPPLAKYFSVGTLLVCSERTAKYLTIIGARGDVYSGINPDTLADEWRRWKNFDVIFEGVL